MINIKTKQLLNVRDAAFKLGCTPNRVVQLANEGKVPAVRDSGGRRSFCVEHIEELARTREDARTAVAK
jgi:predicted site-specific integrase-resolvase